MSSDWVCRCAGHRVLAAEPGLVPRRLGAGRAASPAAESWPAGRTVFRRAEHQRLGEHLVIAAMAYRYIAPRLAVGPVSPVRHDWLAPGARPGTGAGTGRDDTGTRPAGTGAA